MDRLEELKTPKNRGLPLTFIFDYDAWLSDYQRQSFII